MINTFLSTPQVLKLTSLSRTTIWRHVREGAFPAPKTISSGRIVWLETDIAAWQDKLINNHLAKSAA
ncbi:MAG: AlpA family phage regulatory protein [Hyphomicrobiales bacterium]